MFATRRFGPLIPALVLVLVACSSSSDDSSTPATVAPDKIVKAAPTPLPPLSDLALSTAMAESPSHAVQSPDDGPNPSLVDALPTYLSSGFGALMSVAGDAYVTRTLDGSTPPAPGPNAKRLLRFAHLTDLQLSDDESPTRLGSFDSAAVASSALRPQDPDICRMTNAAVRTLNKLHEQDPIAFTLMGGDNSDSAQSNEIDWVLQILDGAPLVQCDSGDIDDPVPGANNDGKDPFIADGLKMPWKWNTGNHDVLIQGTIAITDDRKTEVVGDTAPGGTRDYRMGGAINSDIIVPDARRALLDRAALMARIAGDRDGHGLGETEKASGRATYTFDPDGTPFRFLVIDTCHEAGGADGVIRQPQIDSTIKPLLDKAMSDGKWVILASHHATSSLTVDGGLLGSKETDAVLEPAWLAFLSQYTNIVFSMVGHSHRHRVMPLKTGSETAYWEVMTSALADFPHQLRIAEIYDQDNGWLMMRATVQDLAVEGDDVAAAGRTKGTVDLTSGWQDNDGRGKVEDRNVELWIKKPTPP